jgi:hypothetical protein
LPGFFLILCPPAWAHAVCDRNLVACLRLKYGLIGIDVFYMLWPVPQKFRI